MKKYFLMMLLTCQIAFVTKTYSQNIAINGTGSLPDTSAMLDVSSTIKGFLAPRMTTTQQNAIPLPANGLLIYNTTDNVFKVNTGTTGKPTWISLATGSSAAATNTLSSSSNTMTSTANGVSATAPIVNTNLLSLSGNNLTSTVNGVGGGTVAVEPKITVPNTTLRYWTGYKTFGSFYDSARRAISLTTTGTSGAATYNNTTGVLNIPTYAAGSSGTVTSVGLTSSDITVGGSSPITSSGTYTLALPTVNSNVGTYTNATITVNAKGLITAASSGGGGISTGSASGWALTGNSGTSSTSYIGTSDGQPLTFKVNGTQAAYLGLSSSMASSFGLSAAAGYKSTAIGASANANTGNEAVAVGYNSNAAGYRSIAIGSSAYAYSTNDAIAIGTNTKANSYQGIAIGSDAGTSSGNSALAIGVGASATAYQSVAIGSGANATAQNATAIGNGASASNDNYISIGNTTVAAIRGQVNFTTYSDGRFKRNIQGNVPGLKFIMHLRPVTYNWDIHKFNAHANGNAVSIIPAGYSEQHAEEEEAIRKKESIIYTGFIAQEVEKAAEDCKFNFSGVLKPLNDKDAYSLSYAEFVVPLVKATQELNEKNEELVNKINAQQKMIEQLIEEVNQLKEKSK
ncbi:MAG: tail fiber domain-containing protein [Ferruginibacter sp.]